MHFVQGEDSHYVLYRVRCAGRASSSQQQQQPQGGLDCTPTKGYATLQWDPNVTVEPCE